MSQFAAGYVVPGLPHPFLAPEQNAGWAKIRAAFEEARQEIESTEAELLVLYSTQWISVIGHQIQADPEPRWRHVDPEWHDLGDLPYELRMDADYAQAYQEFAQRRGLHARTVAYHGFPIDTGTVVALKLLNPGNRLPACVVSCNMYADRAETLVLGKAAADAARAQGKKAIAIAVTALSNRMFCEQIDPAEDRISSLKDDEWNRKLLEIFAEGRLEDVSQLARSFSAQANGDQKMKAVWWLAAAMGQHNSYDGRVFEYQPIWGTGAAVIGLTPSARSAEDLEFDEEDVDVYVGDRDVLASAGSASGAPGAVTGPDTAAVVGLPEARSDASSDSIPGAVHTSAAPDPVGAYPHARRVGDFLFLSGVGPRRPGSGDIPGGPVRDDEGRPRDYDVAAQTRAVIANVQAVLEAAGGSLEDVLDITVFLIDMDRDFPTFNRIYAEHFAAIGPARTTIEVKALPTPIAVEFKVLAAAPAAEPR